MQTDFSSNEIVFMSNISKQCEVLIYRHTVKVETLQLAQMPLNGNIIHKWKEESIIYKDKCLGHHLELRS